MMVRKQRRRFEGAETLQAQGFAQLIDFEQRFAERVVGPRAAGANRVIAFAQSGEQIASLFAADERRARARS